MTLSTSAVAVCCCKDWTDHACGLHFVEQAHVLNGDHRLVGEGLDQLDLLLGEWPYGSPLIGQTGQLEPLTKKRHPEDCAISSRVLRFHERVFWVSKNIRNLN